MEGYPIELRLHLKPDGVRMINFRFGLQLYQPRFPQSPVAGQPWVPHPLDCHKLRVIDQGLVECFGRVTKSKYEPLPGSWAETAEYVDAAGWVYYNANGLLSGLITDAAHIKPLNSTTRPRAENDRTLDHIVELAKHIPANESASLQVKL